MVPARESRPMAERRLQKEETEGRFGTGTVNRGRRYEPVHDSRSRLARVRGLKR